LSSRIEGTQASAQTLALFEQMPAIEQDNPDVREVRNNFLSLEYGLTSLADRSLTVGLIKEMHRVLMDGVRGHEKTPGSFRTIPVHIGRSTDVREARFVPPPPLQVESAMAELERYLKSQDPTPTVARAAMIHYQFECIHPFADGNGRIGRVLILLFLCNQGALPMPLFNPSAYLERHRDQYYRHLLDVSQEGAWEDWIRFFANGVVDEAQDAIARLQRLEALREEYQRRVRTPRASALLPILIDHLFAEPAITVNRVAEVLEIGYTSALKLVEKLHGAKIIRRVAGTERNRVFLAQAVVNLFDSPETTR
jgi:Fic family protein